MTNRPVHFLLAIACIHAAWVAVCAGQEYTGGLQTVEQGVVDTGPLATSLRTLPHDLASPRGFERVYQLPGPAGKLMRVSGGLYVVFPQSTYLDAPNGRIATIPPDATFFIGPPPELLRSRHEAAEFRRHSPYFVNLRQGGTLVTASPYEGDHLPAPQSQVRPAPGASPSPAPIRVDRRGGPAIVVDEHYRAARLQELLARAACGG